MNNKQFPKAKEQPTKEKIKELMALKARWTESDGTNKEAAKAYDDALRPYGESDAWGLYHILESPAK